MEYKLTPEFIEIDGSQVPILVCDRETVEYYFYLQGMLSRTDPEYQSQAYKELRNRIMRICKAFYFRCEISGELRLLSSLCEFEGKIIFTRVKRQILRERGKDENKKLKEQSKQIKRQKKVEAKQQAKEQKIQEAKEKSKSLRGKTRLEIAMINGRVTQDEFEQVDKTITAGDYQKEFDTLQKSGALSFITQDRLPKVMTHNIILERIYELQAKRKTREFMETLAS